MDYINFIKSGLNVLIDRSSDYFKNYFNDNTNDDNDVDDDKIIIKKRIFTPISKFIQFQTFISPPTYIIDNIYLGSAFNASHYNTLNERNVGLIINMTNEISNYFDDEIIYKKYGLYDNNSQPIKDYFEKTYNDIINFKNENPIKSIFIHCFMGASRSASIVAYYLIKKHNYTVDDAIVFLKNKRNVVNPTVLFYNELNEIYNI
jgi:protein-tyrosine phosphatase